MKRGIKIKLLVICCCLFAIFYTSPTKAKSLDEIQKEIETYQAQLDQLSAQSKTLSEEIKLYDTRIYLTQLKIDQTQEKITILSGRINELESSLSSLSSAFELRAQESYIMTRLSDPLTALLSAKSASDALSKFEYLKRILDADKSLMTKLAQSQGEYKGQKTDQETLKTQLKKDQASLNKEKVARNTLLAQTKNSEANYQKLLAAAQSELISLRGFSQSKGGGILPPQNSPDGWYFSQRDERWATMCIGSSCGTKNEENIYDVGCLISDVAMVKKKFGENVTPATIASNNSYFFGSTAYMLLPWPAPNGYYWSRIGGYNSSKIDAQLSAGTPVIVHLRINSVDGHFVVLKSGSNGNYVMHDPWEGYDKQFTDYYSTGKIDMMGILTKV